MLAVASAGEPWTFGLYPQSLACSLAPFGLQLLEDLGPTTTGREFGKRATRMRGYAFIAARLAAVRAPMLRSAARAAR